MVLDDLHWNPNKMLSRNKPFNYCISAREGGKSTGAWFYIYNQYRKKGSTAIVIRRIQRDITDTYIGDIENVLNKFLDEPVALYYKKGELSEGVATIYLDKEHKKPFFRVIALSNPLSRIKSLMMPHANTCIFDEFICNTRLGEKYLPDEVFKFKELYNTFQRESDGGMRCIFLGNPYSLYNPYFSWCSVPTKELYPGNFITGNNYCVEIFELSDALKEFILKRNPLYQFDDSYTKYAFDGRAINDSFINLCEKQPEDYELRYVFYIHNKYLGVYSMTMNGFEKVPLQEKEKIKWYWIGIIPDYKSTRRQVACFDYNALIEGNYLLSSEEKKQFYFVKDCFRNRKINFKTIEEAYMFEEVFQLL